MTGCARPARDADVASTARARLDAAARALHAVHDARREALRALLALWPTAAWLAAGATSAKRWLIAYTHCSSEEAHRLERLAELCHRHPALADAVLSDRLSLTRADRLGTAATPDREPWLADSLPAFLGLASRGPSDDDWSTAVRHWAYLVDQERTIRQLPRHSVVLSQRLFGGGEIHGDLSPTAFLTVATALDAWTDDPDPKDAPHQRSLGERRADALDDLCRASLHARGSDEPDFEDITADDPFDGWAPTDDLDEHLHTGDDATDLDELELLRRRLQRTEACERRRARRRTRPRSDTRINVHVDLRTLAGLREHTDLDGLVHRGDGWRLTRSAAELLLCDAALTAVLFDGPGRVLDANDTTERWSPKQRRAIVARDRHCVFPSCARPPRHCDIHHLHHLEHGGPTRTDNAALLCRHHHRLLHHGWHLAVQEGRWVATDPHGTTWTGRPTDPPRTPPAAARGTSPPRPTAKTPS